MIAKRVCLSDLPAEFERVAAELPGITAEHITRAEELVQALFTLDNGQTPEFVDRSAATEAAIVCAVVQFALRHCLDRGNVALVASGARR